MAYIPTDARLYPVFVFYIILCIFSIFFTSKIWIRYFQKKNKTILSLGLAYLFLTLGIIMLTIGMLEAIITGYRKEIYRFSLPFGYATVVLSDIFLFIFSYKLTDKGKKAFVPLILIGAVLIVLLFLPTNYWGYPPDEIRGKFNTRTPITISVVLYSCIIYFSIIVICQNTKKLVDKKKSKVRLTLLSYSMVALICFFILLIADTIMIVYFDQGYTIYVYFAWICACIFVVLSYLSLFVPKTLVKKLEQNNEIE
jgi:hypothetical protein